ncbi:MAG: hypothetical protein ACRCU0_03055 [Candidatus Rhabdochlamydia sp.]
MTSPISLNEPTQIAPIDNGAFEEALRSKLSEKSANLVKNVVKKVNPLTTSPKKKIVRNSNTISYSEKLGYQIQYSIFTCLDKTVEKTKYLRLPAFITLGLASSTYLATQTVSIAELTIHGLGLILCSGPSSENRERGWALLERAPWQIVTLFPGFPLALIASVFWICIDPKDCITSMCEAVKVPLRHKESFAWAQEKLKMLDIDLSAEMKTMKEPKEYKKLPVKQLI